MFGRFCQKKLFQVKRRRAVDLQDTNKKFYTTNIEKHSKENCYIRILKLEIFKIYRLLNKKLKIF